MKNKQQPGKLEITRTQLVRYSIIKAVILTVLGGIALTVYTVQQGYLAERQRISASINNVNSDIQKLDSTFKKAKESLDLYEQLQQSENSAESALSRKNIAESLNILKDRYKLHSLSLRMTPVKDLEDRRYLTDTTQVIQTEITLSFAGMTDELMFGFINDVLRQLPGYTRVSYLKMKRDLPIDNEFLLAVSREEFPPLVSGEVAFHLLGMKKISREESKKKRGEP